MASEITGGEATGDPDFLGATQEASGSLDAFSEDTLASTTLAEAVELERGDVVGRYVVLGRLGAGAMGVVYAAYDPELDRKIALKVLRPAANEGDGHRTRIFREAQALAKLSHPNVVAIHDVGTLGERVWLAMEYVEGRTLGAWRKEQAARELAQELPQIPAYEEAPPALRAAFMALLRGPQPVRTLERMARLGVLGRWIGKPRRRDDLDESEPCDGRRRH